MLFPCLSHNAWNRFLQLLPDYPFKLFLQIMFPFFVLNILAFSIVKNDTRSFFNNFTGFCWGSLFWNCRIMVRIYLMLHNNHYNDNDGMLLLMTIIMMKQFLEDKSKWYEWRMRRILLMAATPTGTRVSAIGAPGFCSISFSWYGKIYLRFSIPDRVIDSQSSSLTQHFVNSSSSILRQSSGNSPASITTSSSIINYLVRLIGRRLGIFCAHKCQHLIGNSVVSHLSELVRENHPSFHSGNMRK